MAKSKPSDVPLQSTKQMLDELDALMEKMLSLPVNDPENVPTLPMTPVIIPEASPTAMTESAPGDSAALSTAPVRPAKKKSKLAELLTELKSKPQVDAFVEPDPLPPPAPISLPMPTPSPAHATTNPPHLPPRVFETEMPALIVPEKLTNTVIPPTLLSKLEPILAEIPEARPPLMMRWFFGPLEVINHLYDGVLSPAGGAGEMLRASRGRTMLGLCGVVLLLASAGWLLRDLLGWR